MPPKKKYCKATPKTKRKKKTTGKRKKSRTKLPRGYPSYCSKFLDYEPIVFSSVHLPTFNLPKPSAPPLFVPPKPPKPPKKPKRKPIPPMPYILQEFKGAQILAMPPLERYPEPSSQGYGETFAPTAFDRPISQAKLEQKYKEEILPPLPPREEKYNKKLEPILYPWQPYLHYWVRPKDILDPGSPIWLTISEEELANLTKQERDYLEEDNTKIEHFPQENIVKYERRQLGDKIILVYDDKPIRKKLNHVLDNEYLPFASAMSLVNAQSEAERRTNVSSRFVMNIIREHPIPPMILKYLDLFANIIAEGSIDMKTWSPIHREADPNKSIDYLLYTYEKWFVTIPINGITLYSKSGLMKILDYLKHRDRLWLHGETWGRLQKQLK